MLYTAFVLAITALTYWLHNARAAPYLLYGAVLILGTVGLWMLAILTAMAPNLVWTFPLSTPVRQTVFVTETSIWAVLLPILFLLGIPVTLWLQDRLSAMYYPKLTRWLIWPPLIAVFHMTAVLLLLAQVMTITPEFSARSNAIRETANLIALLCLIAIYLIAMWSFLRRYPPKHSP